MNNRKIAQRSHQYIRISLNNLLQIGGDSRFSLHHEDAKREALVHECSEMSLKRTRGFHQAKAWGRIKCVAFTHHVLTSNDPGALKQGIYSLPRPPLPPSLPVG